MPANNRGLDKYTLIITFCVNSLLIPCEDAILSVAGAKLC